MFHHSLDDKGRVNLPARFRDVLVDEMKDPRLCMTNFILSGVHCIDVYPYTNWVELENRVDAIAEQDPDFIDFFHNYYVPGVHESQIDKQARLLVPPRLREYAGLQREVVFIGAVKKFRILDRAAWAPVWADGERVAIEKDRSLKRFGV